MSLEVTGKLAVKYDTQQVNERFKKREFVLEISEEINGNVYTNYAKMQLVQNKCEILDRFNEGDSVKVSFNLKGNKWEKDGKVNYITNLDAWRVESAAMGAPAPAQAMPSYTNMNSGVGGNAVPQSTGSYFNPSPESADDLPF
jgi:hypothetical protein